MISKFQKKPAVIEAINFDGKNGFEINKDKIYSVNPVNKTEANKLNIMCFFL